MLQTLIHASNLEPMHSWIRLPVICPSTVHMPASSSSCISWASSHSGLWQGFISLVTSPSAGKFSGFVGWSSKLPECMGTGIRMERSSLLISGVLRYVQSLVNSPMKDQMMIYSCNNSLALGLSVLREWWLGFSGRSKRLHIILRILER